MAEGGSGDFVLGNDPDILFNQDDIPNEDLLENKVVTKNSYESGTASFVAGTEYKYYIFLAYMDNTYYISELFITSNTFRTLPQE